MTQSHLWLCHWERIDGPALRGRPPSSMVWICEYPYHTIRKDGPTEDCTGCPVWDAMHRSRTRRRRDEIQPALLDGRRTREGGGHAA
jgi:hypothetical protein